MKQDMSGHKWYTTKEAAALLKVTDDTIRRWLRAGKLKGRRSTDSKQGQWRIPATEVEPKQT
jgi:excisionase family DNA binding protein